MGKFDKTLGQKLFVERTARRAFERKGRNEQACKEWRKRVRESGFGNALRVFGCVGWLLHWGGVIDDLSGPVWVRAWIKEA